MARTRAVGFRPMYFLGFYFDDALPWRSSIISRSKGAIAPVGMNISLPVAVLVSAPRFRICRSAPFDLIRSVISKRCFVDRSKPVEFRHDQGVALADEIQARLKLGPPLNRRSLLVENLLATGRAKFAKLSLHPGALTQSADSTITSLHPNSRLIETQHIMGHLFQDFY